MIDFEKLFKEKIKEVLGYFDPFHDTLHVERVVRTSVGDKVLGRYISHCQIFARDENY